MLLSSPLLARNDRVKAQFSCHKYAGQKSIFIYIFPAFQTHGKQPNTRGSHHGDWIILNHDKSIHKSSLSLDENTKQSIAVSGWMTIMSNRKQGPSFPCVVLFFSLRATGGKNNALTGLCLTKTENTNAHYD